MRRMTMRAGALALALGVVGVARGGTPPNQEADMTGRRQLHMLHCPSAVPGAQTRVEPVRGGVAVVVSASNEWARGEIRRRAATQREVAANRARGSEEHTGKGTGSARFGYCPGIMMGTSLAAVDTTDGVKLTVLARSSADVDELRKITRARAARLAREKTWTQR